MVEDLDTQDLACLDELPRHGLVLGARRRITARVVVRQDYGCRFVEDGGRKDLDSCVLAIRPTSSGCCPFSLLGKQYGEYLCCGLSPLQKVMCIED